MLFPFLYRTYKFRVPDLAVLGLVIVQLRMLQPLYLTLPLLTRLALTIHIDTLVNAAVVFLLVLYMGDMPATAGLAVVRMEKASVIYVLRVPSDEILRLTLRSEQHFLLAAVRAKYTVLRFHCLLLFLFIHHFINNHRITATASIAGYSHASQRVLIP